jgi:periplasmic protein TonB
MHSTDPRAFHYAVLASLALHALLLFGLPALKDRPFAFPGLIFARLVEPEPAPAPPASSGEPQKPRVETKPVAKRAPTPNPSAPAMPEVEPAMRAEPVPFEPAVAAGATPGQVASIDPQPGIDADAVARFRLDLISEAKRFRRYPPVALDNNWQGRSDVRVAFDASGKRASIAIVRSSGHDILDQQALDTLTKAFVPVPPALRGREFAVEIPVIFDVQDERVSG